MSKSKTKRTLVFDLDGTLETPYFDKEAKSKVKAWMKRHPSGNTFDRMYAEVMEDKLPHFFLNGAFELLRWADDHGFDIVFFSNAVEERNRELCPILMERAFAGGRIPKYRILSRGDCIDTRHMRDDDEKRYQGLWYGNYKKKLGGVVVPEGDVPNTLMIEDDSSYAARGEERNFVYGVYGGCANEFIKKPLLSKDYGQDFHLPFYFCGLLERIVSYADREGVSLADAAVQVQYGDYGLYFPIDGEKRKNSSGSFMSPPSPPLREFDVFKAGWKALCAYNPELKFWGGVVRDDIWQWPVPNVPPPPPPKPKRVVKTDMTRKEAEYWMCRLQEALRTIAQDNVKTVALEGKEFGDGVMQGETGSIPMRLFDFEDKEYFNKKKVNTLYVYGYLPQKRERSEGSYDMYDPPDEGTVRYSICMDYISMFMRSCFGLIPDIHNVESSDCEHWRIPLTPIRL